MAFVDKLSVTFEFIVTSYRDIEPAIKARADAFFDGEPYVSGWIDVTVTDLGLIKVSANAYLPRGESSTFPNFPTELGG